MIQSNEYLTTNNNNVQIGMDMVSPLHLIVTFDIVKKYFPKQFCQIPK